MLENREDGSRESPARKPGGAGPANYKWLGSRDRSEKDAPSTATGGSCPASP